MAHPAQDSSWIWHSLYRLEPTLWSIRPAIKYGLLSITDQIAEAHLTSKMLA
jgi:hypothetical protein